MGKKKTGGKAEMMRITVYEAAGLYYASNMALVEEALEYSGAQFVIDAPVGTPEETMKEMVKKEVRCHPGIKHVYNLD